MDDLGLAVLAAEMGEDARVAADAARTARRRFGAGSPGEAEAAGYHLARFYNVVENLAMRVARAFENRLEEDSGWHVELLRRLTIAIPGVRPALFGGALVEDLQELRGFRHVFRHAYDSALRPERLPELLDAADRVAQGLPDCIRSFVQAVAAEQGWSLGS